MNVQELVDRFRSKANFNVDIKSFIFDDLSSINKDRNKGYPLILKKPPNSVITPFHEDANEPQWENYACEFYIFKPWKKADKETSPLETVYRQLEDIGDGYMRDILVSGKSTNTKNVEFFLIGDKAVVKTRGHHMHVTQLVGIKYAFTLRVFNSVCL